MAKSKAKPRTTGITPDPVKAEPSQRYRLVQDDSSHWFLIPHDRGKEWYLFLAQIAEDPCAEMPSFAKAIDGPHRLTFTDPQED